MNTTPGFVEADVQVLPLLGRSVLQLTIVDNSGNDIKLDPVSNTVTMSVYQNPDDMIASPPIAPLAVVSLVTNPGISIDLPETLGSIEVEFSAAQAKLFSPQWLYTFVLIVTDTITGQVILSRSGNIQPVLESLSQAFEITTPSTTVALYTTVLNTLSLSGVQGGAGFLDGITTTTQGVGCVVQFDDPTTGTPAQWILEVSQHVSDVTHQRGLDWNTASNPKVWRKIM